VSRQFEEGLSDAGVTKDGSRLERAAEKEKGKENGMGWEPAKDGPSSSHKEGRREEDDARARGGQWTGLLQLRSLASYLLLQPSSAGSSRPYLARRSKLRQQMLYRAP